MTLKLPFCAALAAVCLLNARAEAQQFQYVGDLPGPVVWSEGIECADVDNDGDLDVFVADGDGFSSAGTQRQNTLLANKLVELGPGIMADESVFRLGMHLSNAKQVITGDIQGDGWIDALFCNAYNTDEPFLYVNRGASNPGRFIFDGIARGFTEPLSSGDGQFGDLDNDGDLDLILSDSGSSFLGGIGDEARLFFNDGAGFFTEDPVALGAVAKIAQMDVHLVDIDNDWDLDFFGPCRAGNVGGKHYLMLNDGAGNFTDASLLVPDTSTSVYEAEVSDLDGDTDMDMFFLSLTGGGGFTPLREGAVENDLLPGGSLAFAAGPALGGDDDNEVALLDYDVDGDLDVLIGSLGASEKIVRNDGAMSFVQTGSGTVIESVGDSTLDCTVADMNNDGAYDILTAQGESNPAQYANKIYINMGAADDLAPVIEDFENPSSVSPLEGPWVVRARVRDQVMDDGKNWVSAQVTYSLDANPTPTVVDAFYSGGGLYRFEMADTAAGAGATLTYELEFTDWAGNTSSTGPQVADICGSTPYGDASPVNSIVLVGGGGISLGTTFEAIHSNVPGPTATMVISLGDASIPLFGGLLLLDPSKRLDGSLSAGAVAGEATINVSIPAVPALAGATIYFQSWSVDAGQPFGAAFSNGLRLTICSDGVFEK